MKTTMISAQSPAIRTESVEVQPASTTGVLVRRGLFAGLIASAATVGVAAAADAANVSLAVSGESIPIIGFGQMTFLGALIGTILAVVLAKRADHPRHTFVVTTVALTALSIIPDVVADAAASTKLVLALSHVVAAAIVIPAIAARLADRQVP